MTNTYTTIQGDMWDLIAKRLYNDEASLNVLLEANQQYADIVVFPAGIVLALETRQSVLAVFQNVRQRRGEVTDPLRDGDAVFGQQAANLVGLRRPRLDEALPGAVHGEYRLLFAILDRNKAHRRACRRFRDRLGVPVVVLLCLDVRAHVLR